MNVMGSGRSEDRGSPVSDIGQPGILVPPHMLVGPRAVVLVQYLAIARRRRWVIVGSVLVCLLLGLLITLLMTPQYTSSATVEIQRESRNFTNVEGVESTSASQIDNEFYQTQYGLLRARSLGDRVARDLKLYDNAHFFQMLGNRDASRWFDNGRPIAGSSTREQRIRAAGDTLLKHLAIDPGRLSRLVDIDFTSPEAAFSKQIVDTWASTFIEMTLERRFEATTAARTFLERRLEQLRAKTDESERGLVDYASQQGIINLPATTPAQGEGGVTGERSIIADDLASLNRELARATADRVEAQSRLSVSGSASKEGLDNQAIASLRLKRAELAADYAKLLVQFEPSYPPAQALQSQIKQLDASLSREDSRIDQTIQETYRASVTRENALRKQVDALKSGVLDLRRRSIQYNVYQRDVDTNHQLYDALLQRYKEIGVAGGVGVNNIAIVDRGDLPEKPSSPKALLNMLLALVAGLVIGGALALGLEQIDQGIADPADIERDLKTPLLGTVPKVDSNDLMLGLQDRKSAMAESYLSLLTSLSFSTDHGIPRILAVTSTRPGEGKSTTSYALALSIARSNRSVLLIDADMRSPSLHEMLNVPNVAGLSNYLSGADDWQQLAGPTTIDNLSIMSAGPYPPSASELLSGSRLEQLLALARTSFDHIVIDAPPVMGLADAPLIASKVEGLVFVIESRKTQRGMARVAIERLQTAHANIVGVALTKFDEKTAGYGYGYGYGYSYGQDIQAGPA